MKKSLCFILALSMCVSAFSCSEKKKDSNPEPAPESITEDIALEKPFMEYTADSLKEINVALTITDSEMPLTQQKIDCSEIDFGAYIPPCKNEDVREKFKPYYAKSGDHEEYNNSLVNGAKGNVYLTAADGNMLYFVVDYDKYCIIGHHESAVFSYNPYSKETTELYRYSSNEKELRITDIKASEGKVYLCYIMDDASVQTVSVIESGQLHDIFTDNDCTLSFGSNYTDRIIVNECISVPAVNGSEFTAKFLEYDKESGEWSIIRESTEEIDEFTDYYSDYYDYSFTNIAAWREKPEGSRKYDIVSDYWRIPTNSSNPQIAYASPDKLLYTVTQSTGYIGNDSTIMHFVDIEKREHYVTDITSVCDTLAYVNGCIISARLRGFNSDPAYCIMPELGLAFPLNTGEDTIHDMRAADGTVMLSGTVVSAVTESSVIESEKHIYLYK